MPFLKRSKNLPNHIAIIMDGNRRWAKKKGLAAINGHEYVVDHIIEPLVDRCIELNIQYLTLWAFSTENWQRDRIELEAMMQLFRRAFERKVEDLHKKGVQLRIIGDIEKFPQDIALKAKEWIEISKKNTKIVVSFALNYGGREEILKAINCVLDKKNQKAVEVTAKEFEQCLSTHGIPDPDLIIRPGGQLRLSGFMPWQSVYSELYFTDILMPEFDVKQLNIALDDFAKRQRRFGK